MHMFGSLAKNLFGSGSDRATKKFTTQVAAINGLEDQIAEISDDDLRNSVTSLRERLDAGSSLEELLPEAMARDREAAKRALGQRQGVGERVPKQVVGRARGVLQTDLGFLLVGWGLRVMHSGTGPLWRRWNRLGFPTSGIIAFRY